MASTFRVENLVAAQERLAGDLTFAKTAGDVVLTVPDQVNATLSVPDMAGVSQSVVLTSQTQNVSNKAISASTVASDTPFVDTTDATKRLFTDLAGASASTKTTLDFNQTVDRTVTFPDATGTAGLFTDLTGAAVDQLVRMDGVDTMKASSVTLSNAGALGAVASITGKAATDLTIQSVAGQSVVINSDTGVSVTGSDLTLAADLVFDRPTNDLTLVVADQTVGAVNLGVPDLAGVSQDIVLTDKAQTISNKTVANSTLLSNTEFGDSVDPTKQVAFDISGATTGTTTTLDFNQTVNRTVTFPDADITVASQPTGADNQLLRMDGTNATQASSVTLSDAGALVGVLSVAGSAGNDLTLTAPTGQSLVLTSDTNVAVTNSASVGGNLSVAGNLNVAGTTTSINSTVVTIADNNLLLSSNYTTAAAKTGGITVNYLPTATADTVAAGGFATTSTVATTGAATFAAGDIVLISSAASQSNNGLFEVLSHAANVLTIDTTPSFDFLQNVFVVDTTVAGDITKVNVAILQAGTDGKFEVAKGSSTTGMVFVDLALVTDLIGVWQEVTLTTTNATPTTAVTITPTANKSIVVEVVYTGRQQGSVNSNCGNVTREFYKDATTVNAMGSGVWSYGNFGGTSAAWVAAVNASSGDALIQVTGAAATNIDWKIMYRYLQSQ